MKIPIIENVHKLNDELAALNRQRLRDSGVFTVDLIGAPGCGKTELLVATMRALGDRYRIGVVAGDLATSRDAERLAAGTDQVVQINTGNGCHLDANQVKQAFDRISLDQLDLLVIENVGNMICTVGYDLGQDLKVGMFSVADGDDKPIKHPHLVTASSVILLNKTDLLPHVPFRREVFLTDVERLSPDVDVIEISVLGNELDPWCRWIERQIEAARGT